MKKEEKKSPFGLGFFFFFEILFFFQLLVRSFCFSRRTKFNLNLMHWTFRSTSIKFSFLLLLLLLFLLREITRERIQMNLILSRNCYSALVTIWFLGWNKKKKKNLGRFSSFPRHPINYLFLIIIYLLIEFPFSINNFSFSWYFFFQGYSLGGLFKI